MLGVCVGVAVCEEVCVGVGVREGEEDSDAVELGVCVGVCDEVGVPLGVTVGVPVPVCVGVSVPVRLGVELTEGLGDAGTHVAAEPVPICTLPAWQTQDAEGRPGLMARKPGEHVQKEGEPVAVAPRGHAVHCSAVVELAPLL